VKGIPLTTCTIIRPADGAGRRPDVVDGVADRGSAKATTFPTRTKEPSMTQRSLIALAAFFVAFAAHAVEPATTPIKPASPVPVAAPGVAQKSAPISSPDKTAAPQKTAGLSQQDKMRECNKQATGKKGAERKTFMKTCLSRKA
jgi:psiF repeat-containing protein